MAAKVRRLRPKRHDRIAETLQLALELPLSLSPSTRAELTDALSSYAPTPWPFVMLNREQAREIACRIAIGPRPKTTLVVWFVALSYAAHGTGEIEVTRQELATKLGTSEREVSRALSRLVKLGAFVRTSRGRYMVHPAVAWVGPLPAREAAARKLTPVE
jgi:CRP-like cAMP-binding protein